MRYLRRFYCLLEVEKQHGRTYIFKVPPRSLISSLSRISPSFRVFQKKLKQISIGAVLGVKRLSLQKQEVPPNVNWGFDGLLSDLQGETINQSGWIFSAIKTFQFQIRTILS